MVRNRSGRLSLQPTLLYGWLTVGSYCVHFIGLTNSKYLKMEKVEC